MPFVYSIDDWIEDKNEIKVSIICNCIWLIGYLLGYFFSLIYLWYRPEPVHPMFVALQQKFFPLLRVFTLFRNIAIQGGLVISQLSVSFLLVFVRLSLILRCLERVRILGDKGWTKSSSWDREWVWVVGIIISWEHVGYSTRRGYCEWELSSIVLRELKMIRSKKRIGLIVLVWLMIRMIDIFVGLNNSIVVLLYE